MTFKSFLDTPCGIRYMFDTLGVQSPCGRKALLDSKQMRSIQEIERAYKRLKEVFDLLTEEGDEHRKGAALCVSTGAEIGKNLHCLRDVSGTISRLAAGAVLDDIELFEIKYLSLISEEVRRLLEAVSLKGVVLPVLERVVGILDPDGLRISSFYVYDAYSLPLRELRSKIKGLNALLEGEERRVDSGETTDVREELQQLFIRMNELEGEIRKELCTRLKPYARELEAGLTELANLDVLLAKAVQIRERRLVFPKISMDGTTVYKGMFHPQIKEALSGQGREFTPIDLTFSLEPITLIGANMGGKTVVLKMAALNQLLFQFGFGIPAEYACIDIKNRMMLCVGDEQNELVGLSSFAAEMRAIDQVLQRVKRGERLLALIDEPARTTNPVEGTALVEALIKVLCKKEVSVLMTTHYNIEGDFYRRLRVKGLANGVMDYRLEEVSGGEIPHEAVGIAQSLGIDREWIGEAAQILQREKLNK